MKRPLRHDNMAQQIRDANRHLVKQVRAFSGADSDSVRQSAAVLAKAMRAQLSKPATGRRVSLKTRRVHGGEPSAPGEPPRLQSGKSRRSVRHAVVGGVRRVGTGLFTLRLQELGAVGNRGVIEPRPWARPALEVARKDMVDAAVQGWKEPTKVDV